MLDQLYEASERSDMHNVTIRTRLNFVKAQRLKRVGNRGREMLRWGEGEGEGREI